ncbi:MAG TPA: alkaline phosphatase, partial [Methylophaga aminisulfidivorans]|nr:alkaline phosphatase [Methylophaga aminisulfidivorans]
MSALFASKVAAEQNVIADNQLSSHWYIDAVDKMAHKPILATKKTAKNVILFVGDGMGISTITAARILDGQLKGQL